MGFLLEDVLYVLLCCFKVDFQGGHSVLDVGWLHVGRMLRLFPFPYPDLIPDQLPKPRSTTETLIYDRWNPEDFLPKDTPMIPLSIPEASPIYTTHHPLSTSTPSPTPLADVPFPLITDYDS